MAQKINPLNSISATYTDDSRDERSPREKWDQRNKESKERQRANRERNAKADDNTGNRPIQDNGIDGVPRNPFVSSTSGGTGGGGNLPNGKAGDMLYNDGSGWVTLAKPSTGAVLRHNGTAPYWEQPVDVCS